MNPINPFILGFPQHAIHDHLQIYNIFPPSFTYQAKPQQNLTQRTVEEPTGFTGNSSCSQVSCVSDGLNNDLNTHSGTRDGHVGQWLVLEDRLSHSFSLGINAAFYSMNSITNCRCPQAAMYPRFQS